METPKLIAVDLDGTLLKEDHTLAPEGGRALAQAAQRGVNIVLSTTRNIYSARTFARKIGLNTPIICSNGAQVWASPDGPMWVGRTIHPALAEAITTLADDNHWHLITTVGEMTYFRQKSGQTPGQLDDHHTILATNADTLSIGPAIRILNYEAEAIAAIRQLLAANFAEQYHLETYYYPDSTVKSIGVYAPGSDKGTALAYVLNRLTISPDEVIVIGDNANDLPMWPYARTRVAMGNATADVKRQATVVAPTNDEQGVAWAVDTFILKNIS